MTLLSVRTAETSSLNCDVLFSLVFIWNSSDRQILSREIRECTGEPDVGLGTVSSHSHLHYTPFTAPFTRLKPSATNGFGTPLTTWRRKQVKMMFWILLAAHAEAWRDTCPRNNTSKLVGTFKNYGQQVYCKFAKSNRWLVNVFSVEWRRTCWYMDSTLYTEISQVSRFPELG